MVGYNPIRGCVLLVAVMINVLEAMYLLLQ
ncbi:hypothetical protein PENNAL_c0940G11456 [Penicillium nalgiovense]|uniref:Uncharacterized protein n=1 Tax=Penicillium nalgiovense TaxID=60175 RepID=A0A1V6TW78_PENNA|nr:hypothetical protein PENNAL_c0940G11456 [Penicillium nalgiovense]